MGYTLKIGEIMIASLTNNSKNVLDELVRQFGLGVLSYDELWDELEAVFISDNCISGVSVGGGI